MTTMRIEMLAPADQPLRNKPLMCENKRPWALVATHEMANGAIENEGLALSQHVEARANEKPCAMASGQERPRARPLSAPKARGRPIRA